MSRLSALFGPREPDVLAGLVDMAERSAAAVAALHAWVVAPGEAAPPDLRAAADEVRSARRRLAELVADALILPLDPEEVLEVSERLEAVTNTAYRLQREAQLLGAALPPELGVILALAVLTSRETAQAITLMRDQPRRAQAAAEDILDQRWDAEDAYADLIKTWSRSAAPGGDGPAQRELAHLAESLVEMIAHTARRVVHAVSKRS
jgi:hypothetical protein